jgi:hypothetical protein
VAIEFGYGPKQIWVEAEHENMLTVLVEHERAIREREVEKRERERERDIRLGHCRISSEPCSGGSCYRNWQFASFNEESNFGIERERETRGFA